MGVIKILNTGINMLPPFSDAYYNKGIGNYTELNTWKGKYLIIKNGSYNVFGRGCKINIKPNTNYTFAVKYKKIKQADLRVKISEDSKNLNYIVKNFEYNSENAWHVWNFTYNHNDLKLPYKYLIFLGYDSSINTEIWISHIILLEGTYTANEIDAIYQPPRNDYIEFDGEMFGMNGIYDELHDDGTLIKRWQRESITITSGSGTVSKNGAGTCILVADSDGLPYEGTVSGTNVITSAPDGTYTIIYQLATPTISKIALQSNMKALGSGHNQFLATKYVKDTFTGDGSTTTFNLSKTADSTSYIVKVNGVEVTSGVTKNTTSVVFDTAPRNGAIIEVYYNAEAETLWCAAIEIYEPSGTQETLSQFTELSITENDDVVVAKFDDGTFKRVVKSRDFTVTLNKSLIENATNFIQKYRDKKFRLIITNSRDSSVEYVAMCEFDTSRSKNYMDGSENITIRCTDLYD